MWEGEKRGSPSQGGEALKPGNSDGRRNGVPGGKTRDPNLFSGGGTDNKGWFYNTFKNKNEVQHQTRNLR